MHNTLASSDYGLLDEETLEPRPDYWAALLWKRTMGSVVLDPGTPRDQALRIYAHCMNGQVGGVTILALNTDTEDVREIKLPVKAKRYTLTASDLTSASIALNGIVLRIGSDGSVPPLQGESLPPGTIRLTPASVTFLVMPTAGNQSCQIRG